MLTWHFKYMYPKVKNKFIRLENKQFTNIDIIDTILVLIADFNRISWFLSERPNALW